MKTKDEISRREFLKYMGLLAGTMTIGSTISLGGCGYPTAELLDADSYSYERDKISIVPEQVPQLSFIGSSAAIIRNDLEINLIIVRADKDSFAVALNQCPHKEKHLGYDPDTSIFICASGRSKFKLDGSIIEGPVDSPLSMYKWRYIDGKLEIDLSSV